MGNDNGSVNPQATQNSNAVQQATIDPTLLNSLEWRLIGPFRGGRVVAVAGDPVHPQVFYFGSTGGGVWKTTDGGILWENVSDGYFKRASVGAIAVSTSDANVIYVGMGETTIRSNVSHGDGVYKSTDGGKTWIHLGLADTRNIAKIRVHPQNPDLVYVAALGHAHGPTMGAKPGSRSCSAAIKLELLISRWTRIIPVFYMQLYGKPSAGHMH